MPEQTRTIKTDILARVEGEGAMFVKIEDGRVTDVKLRIYEPPRFFEAFLRGRAFTEAPDITARICGICPVAYQMSAVQAMEQICVLRWMDSYVRFGVCSIAANGSRAMHCTCSCSMHPTSSATTAHFRLARDQPALVTQALELKKTGNQLMALIGGREIHPINVRVGGWYRVPRKVELAPLIPKLEQARQIAVDAVRFVSAFDFPDYEQDYELVSLSAPGEYPIDRGRIVSNNGLDIDVSQYDQHFVEEHVPWSNALHSRLRERGSYLCGPLARFALAGDTALDGARAAASEAGLTAAERNPFRSIVVRSIEMVYAAEEALRLIAEYEEPDAPTVEVKPRREWVTDAPKRRGGSSTTATSSTTTGRSSMPRSCHRPRRTRRTIEEDLRGVVERSLDLSDDELSRRCEQTIRNYDPCISCATHFLKLEVERS